MMDKWLNSVLQRIAEGSLLPSSYFAELDCNAALDARDHDQEFESSWLRIAEEINLAWADASVAEDLRTLAEDTRRESFLAVSRATRQHEIASYVSDDFDLIVRGRLVGLSDPFLDHLWSEYDADRFPSPPF